MEGRKGVGSERQPSMCGLETFGIASRGVSSKPYLAHEHYRASERGAVTVIDSKATHE